MTPQTLWQTTIETGIETGQTPLLDFGLSCGILLSLAPLLALAAFAEDRRDLTTPRVLVGGESSSWLVALLTTPHTTPPQQSPALAITYGGADQATQIASVALYQNQPVRITSRRELPPGYMAQFLPAAHAGTVAWGAWSFVFWGAEASVLRAVGDRWLNWAGLLLAIGLLVVALLV